VDEAKNLQRRDVTIVEDERSGDRILEIEVRGKRGVGYCKGMPSAVRPYERLLGRPKYVKQGRARAKLPPSTEPAQLPKPSSTGCHPAKA